MVLWRFFSCFIYRKPYIIHVYILMSLEICTRETVITIYAINVQKFPSALLLFENT